MRQSEMLAEAKLHVRAIVLQVCLLVIAQGYLGIAMKISATMMKRGHLKETAKVSRYLVAAGHSDFKKCLDGEASQLHFDVLRHVICHVMVNCFLHLILCDLHVISVFCMCVVHKHSILCRVMHV